MIDSVKIIIIGTSHHNTLSVIRCYGERGINPYLILIGNKDSYILTSKYISKYYIAEDSDNALELLTEHFQLPGECNIVFSCSDTISHLINEQYSKYKNNFTFFNCGKDGLLTQFMNKDVQVEYAKKVGLSVPSTHSGYLEELLQKEDIIYPCIIKPQASINGGKKILICNNRIELNNAVNKFGKDAYCLVQEYIQKEYEIVLLGISTNEEVYLPGYIHKHRDIIGATTYSTVKSISDIKTSIIECCKELCKALHYEGVFGIEMIKNKEDFYFIELNLRNDATTYALSIAGVNLPYAYFEYVVHMNYQEELNKTVNPINAIVEFNDIYFLLKKKISIKQWRTDLKNSKCKYFYNKDDIKPFKRKRLEFIKSTFKILIGKIFGKRK